MMSPAIVIALGAVAASQGGAHVVPMSRVMPNVVAQAEPMSIASLVPASIAAPSAAISLLAPVLLRRGRAAEQRRSLRLAPLPQDYMYFPRPR